MADPLISTSPPDLRSAAIDCLRAPYDAPAAARARASLADPAFDWDAFLNFINQERITPLIDQAASAWGIFPPGFASTVHQAYLQVMWTNVLRQEELRQILTHLTAAGIPAVLLKGPRCCTWFIRRAACAPWSIPICSSLPRICSAPVKSSPLWATAHSLPPPCRRISRWRWPTRNRAVYPGTSSCTAPYSIPPTSFQGSS